MYVQALGMQHIFATLRTLRRTEFRVLAADVHAIYFASCHWDIGRYQKSAQLLHSLWLNASREAVAFGGPVVVGTCTAKHARGDLSLMVGDSAYHGVEAAIRRAIPRTWSRLDLFSSSITRPDRSPDSFHYSLRKCGISPQHKLCPLHQRNADGCCLRPDSFPHSVSPTWAAMLLDTLCRRT